MFRDKFKLFIAIFSLLVSFVVTETLPSEHLQGRADADSFASVKNVPELLDERAATAFNLTDTPANVTLTTIQIARAIVADAIKKVSIANKARVENPIGNTYTLKPSSAAKVRRDAPSLFDVTPEIAAACALIAEIDAAAQAANGTLHTDYSAIIPGHKRGVLEGRTASNYWMANLQNLGTQPFGNDTTYQVFRNVNDTRFAGGAKGDGMTVSLVPNI